MTSLERELRALPDRMEALLPPADLVDAVRHRHARRRWDRLQVAAVAAVVLAVTAVPAGLLRRAATEPPRGDLPVDARLVPWPTRGDLADDRDETAAALGAAKGQLRYDGPLHALWIGRVGGHAGRVPIRAALVQRYVDGKGIVLEWLFRADPAAGQAYSLGPRPTIDVRRDAGVIAAAVPHQLPRSAACSTTCPGDGSAFVLALARPGTDRVGWSRIGGPRQDADVEDGTALFRVGVQPADRGVLVLEIRARHGVATYETTAVMALVAGLPDAAQS